MFDDKYVFSDGWFYPNTNALANIQYHYIKTQHL